MNIQGVGFSIGLIKVFIFCFIFLLSFPQSVPAQNSRWQYVTTDADGVVFSLDKTSVKKSGDVVTSWHKSLYQDKSYQINLTKWRCARKQFLIVVSNVYSPKGDFVSQNPGSGWVDVPPDSISERFYNLLCDSRNIQEMILENESKTARVITKQANIREMPSMNAAVVRKAKEGTVFHLVDEESQNGWYQIYVEEDVVAWIHGNTIEILPEMQNPQKNNRKLPPSLLDNLDDEQK